jgi:hypothetical protein
MPQEFWSSIKTLASTFREEDPKLTGKLRSMVDYFDTLPDEEQRQFRMDVQLLTVQFSKLALAMTNKLDAPHAA